MRDLARPPAVSGIGRELSDGAIAHQAEQLHDYMSRGGSASRWLASKDLAPADRAAVLVALGDLESGEASCPS